MVENRPLGKGRKKSPAAPVVLPPPAAEPTEGRQPEREPLTVENARLRVELARAEARLSRPAPLPPEHFQPANNMALFNDTVSLTKVVADNLPIFRAAARGMSQRELADRAGISKNHMSLIESGQANITLETLEKIARALERSPLELLVKKTVQGAVSSDGLSGEHRGSRSLSGISLSFREILFQLAAWEKGVDTVQNVHLNTVNVNANNDVIGIQMDRAAEAHMRALATTFSQALRRRRLIDLDISLNELADRCGLTKNHLSRIEGGRNDPQDIRLSSMARIAVALGVDVRSMLVETEPAGSR